VRRAERTLERWLERVPALAESAEALRAAGVHLDDGVRALVSFVDEVEADPARLEEVEGRLAEVERLEHKYATDADGLLELASELEGELDELERTERDRSELAAELATAQEAVERRAAELSRARREALAPLAAAVTARLRELGLGRARFEVRLFERDGDRGPRARLGPAGVDQVEFLLAANPGEPLRPLRQVASGGEVARIMLALRSSLAASGAGRVLVFDEIDSGVGGHLAPRVAHHLDRLAAGDQVLCVTHLPAIAARARQHLRVAKEVRGGRTRATAELLGGEARVAEVADMIAGGAEAETARAEARRLLESAP